VTDDLDHRVRPATFKFLEKQYHLHGERRCRAMYSPDDSCSKGPVYPSSLRKVFSKPAILGLPLSITTVRPVEGKPRPYDDDLDPSGLLRHRYNGFQLPEPSLATASNIGSTLCCQCFR